MVNKDIDFDADQIMEIEAGRKSGLDVSYYAKKEFLAIQMQQIRLGLKDNLNVSDYAKPEYDWFQMEEIRKGMLDGIDYTKYLSPDIDYEKMREIRKGLGEGVDLSKYVALKPDIIRELRRAIRSKVAIVEFINEGYVGEQLSEIRVALENGLDIKKYISNELIGASIREVAKGLKEGIDPAVYANVDYCWRQMREIRLGLEHHIYVGYYTDSLFSWQQMREIRLGLEDGIDIFRYLSFRYTASDMERIRKSISKEVIEHIIDENSVHIDTDKFSVYISNDEMEACIEVRGGKDLSVTKEEIIKVLKSNGVLHGILEDEIVKLIDEKRFNETVVVAEGKPAMRGNDGWYEFFFKTEVDKRPDILPDGSADYKNIKWFEVVEEGQKIAVYHDARLGTAGYTVTGKMLSPKKGHEKNVIQGKGFVLEPDGKTYKAAFSGRITLQGDHTIEISRMCVFNEVNYTTGNINFDGSVLVRGNVERGASICATEDVIIEGFVESAYIKCGGEVLLKQGANGAGRGCIEAGGKVMGSFFDSIRVISGGDIHSNYCLNCNLYAKGMIVINGRMGVIAGGTAQALRSIRAFNVGNRVGIHTILKIGIDDSMLKEKNRIEKAMADVNRELTLLGHAYNKYQLKYAPEVRNTMEIYLKIEKAIYTKELEYESLQKAQKLLLEQMISMSGSDAIVKGCIFEGTDIIINNCKWSAYSVKNVTVKCTNSNIVVFSN